MPLLHTPWLQHPLHSSTGSLPGSCPVSPSTWRVHGAKGTCPLGAHTLPQDHSPRTYTPRIPCQDDLKLTSRVHAGLFPRVHPPKMEHNTGLGVAQGQHRRGAGESTRSTHLPSLSSAQGRGNQPRACSSLWSLAPGSVNVQGEPVQGHRLGSASSLLPTAARNSVSPQPL